MPSPRRTFAIISHPDAGKTTLTEKLLQVGGAIHLAGAVKARGAARRARSDWMKIEQQRGISVTSSVMTFEKDGVTFNLLDTPGHEDFSEDTYRTLTAVDSAVMVIDAARGIEAQTRKLFEVCRLRSVPIITFVNKVDREGRSPFELLDEIADVLALDVCPMNWPIGMGGEFEGVLDLTTRRIGRPEGDSRTFQGSSDEAPLSDRFAEEVELAEGGYASFDARGVSRRRPDAGVFRLGAQGFRPRRADRRARRLCAEPTPAARRAGAGVARWRRGDGFRVQGAGQHGPAAPRPHRLHAAVLGDVPARHEADPLGQRQADRGPLADPVLRPGPRDRRRGVSGRHHRHPQPRHAARRRHVVGAGRRALHRPSQFRARDPAPRAAQGFRPRPSSCARRSTTWPRRA